LAVARNLRVPSRSDAGVVTRESVKADEAPTLPEILAKTVPVGLVSAYTAFIAVVTELVAEPTSEQPDPDQHLLYRWIAFVALVAFAAGLTYFAYDKKAGDGARFPLVEIASVTIAATAWGLAVPESPLLAAVDKTQGAILVALIGFIGVGTNLVLSAKMKGPAQ
jgi:hypothetical protein